MKIYSTIAIVFFVFLQVSLAVQCPATHFDFIGTYTIGKQDELNKTFTKLQEKIVSLPDVSFNASATATYTISNTKPKFFYRDSTQKAEILGNDTIIIYGGRLEVDLDFEWSKKISLFTINGTGSAFGLSDPIEFAKMAVIVEEGSFFSFQLLDYTQVTWNNGEVFQINRIDPATTTDQDRKSLVRLLNNVINVTTIRQVLEEQIDKIFSYYLRASLHDQHMPIDNHFDYIWVPGNGKPNVTIPFSRRAVTVDIEQAGVQLTFEVQAANYPDWKCGNRSVPLLPLNPRVYGSTQQFISFDFYENVIRYAVSKGYLDADLSRGGWQSRMFQFFAGDLYEVLAKIQDKYYANQPVTGNCKPTYTGLKVWKSGFDTFNVSIHFDCELNIKREKIMTFAVGLQLEVQGIPQQTTMDFKFRGHEEFVTFYQYADYKIINEQLARAMIRHCLNRLYEGNLFGSGWPMSPPRDYPHMMTEENYTIVYDSTHVDPHLSEY